MAMPLHVHPHQQQQQRRQQQGNDEETLSDSESEHRLEEDDNEEEFDEQQRCTEATTTAVQSVGSSISSARRKDGSGTTMKRKRKATYHVRKDEIETLQERMEELEHELKALKFQALVQQGTARKSPPASLSKGRLTEYFLRDAIQSQQCVLAGLQAMVSNYSRLQEISPSHVVIRLGKDLKLRQEALLAAREKGLQQAKRFVLERNQGMDMAKVYYEQERYETVRGDYCVMGFDVAPLLGATSVKRVYDDLLFHVSNVEITFSEMMGHITVRENHDDEGSSVGGSDPGVSQLRVVSTLTDGGLVEANAVLYSDFQSDGGGDKQSQGEFAIIVVDYVDEDELYPYRPDERVRRDTSCIFTLRACTRRPTTETDVGEETFVVMTRWSLTRLHKSTVVQGFRAVQELRASIGAWGDKIVQSLYENTQLNARTSAPVV